MQYAYSPDNPWKSEDDALCITIQIWQPRLACIFDQPKAWSLTQGEFIWNAILVQSKKSTYLSPDYDESIRIRRHKSTIFGTKFKRGYQFPFSSIHTYAQEWEAKLWLDLPSVNLSRTAEPLFEIENCKLQFTTIIIQRSGIIDCN